MLLSTVFAFLSRSLCHTTCHDVPITKHDVFHDSAEKYRNNYVSKIANVQLGDLFFFVFFSKILLIFSLFHSFFPFLISFVLPLLSNYSACQRCRKLHCQSLVQPQTALELEVGAPPGKNGENFSFNRRCLPIRGAVII